MSRCSVQIVHHVYGGMLFASSVTIVLGSGVYLLAAASVARKREESCCGWSDSS